MTPRVFVVALFQAHRDVGAHVDQGFDHVHFFDAVESLADDKTLDQGCHAHRFDLGAFTRCDLADDRNPDRVFPMGDALELEHRAQGAWVDVAHRLAVRAFFFHVIGRDDAFENDFRCGRHFEIDGLSFDQFHWCAHQSAGERELVDIRRHFLGRAVGHRGDGADDDGDLERLAILRHFSQWVDKSCGVPDINPAEVGPLIKPR